MKITANFINKLIISTLFVASTNTVHADRSYLGVQYAATTYSETGFDDANPTALIARLGLPVQENVFIEARLGVGLSDDSSPDVISGTPVDIGIEIDNLLSIYGVGQIALSKRTALYGLLGATRGSLTASASALGTPFSYSDDDSSISYGIGANFNVSNSTAINIEYISYLNGSEYDLTALSVGLTLDFGLY